MRRRWKNILIDGFSGGTGYNGGDPEVCLDIYMAISMAPGLSNVLVYEGNQSTDDVLNRMATDDAAAQLSCSWVFDSDDNTDQIFQQYAAQGQTFFQACGDWDAYSGPVLAPADDPNITIVGGTFLSTAGPLGAWTGESVWNRGNGIGTGGGISTVVPIPSWQQGVNMSVNGGSTSMRNVPDVAMVAENVWVIVTGSPGTQAYGGTSVGAPLWAGFTALVNQQASQNGQAPVGFVNPAIYSIGQSTNYTNCFNDITAGNNTSPSSPTNFYAEQGFNLCTGWGTPTGSNLIDALLVPADALVISPQSGFTAVGPIGGPFNVTSQTCVLTNAGNAPLNWSAATTAPWLTISATNGTLAPGGPAFTVTAALNSLATNLLLGDFSATLSFTNLGDNTTESWPYELDIGNGGFETGDFTDWVFTGDTNFSYPVGNDDSVFPGSGDPLPGVPYWNFVHSGRWGAFLGQGGFLGTLSQNVPTTASQYYLLSFWLSNYADNGATTPNQFIAQWNGATLFNQYNLPARTWTNLQFIVTNTGSAGTVQFGFRNDPGAFGLDDVTLQAVPTPMFQSVTQTNGAISFSWNALAGLTYQLQYNTDLSTTNWANLGPAIIAVTNVVNTADILPPDPQRFYRFVVSP